MKFYIETYGCSRNMADSEAIAGALAVEHEQVSSAAEADIIVVNTCIVKTPTENKVTSAIKKYAKTGKRLIVAGCMPVAQVDKVRRAAPGCEVWGLRYGDDLESPRMRTNKIVGIIPISSGCLGDCTYCIVRKARGRLKSYAPEKIVKAVENAVKEGCREIWITAQDTGAYGKDIGTNLPALLEKICAVNGEFKVRVGMMNPNHVKEFLLALIKTLKHEKMFKFLHIPVQSGNNEVLKAMNRYYTAEDYKKIISEVRKEIPKASFSTDIITGFPGETDEQFSDTLKLMEETRPDSINISRFGPRPGTPAAEMKQHLEIVKKKRSRKMTALRKKLGADNNKAWIGWSGDVLIDEVVKNNTTIGRNFAYKQVVLKGQHPLGKVLKVKIRGLTPFYLIAE